MKKFIPFIFIMIAGISVALSADTPPQLIPQISDKILQNNVRVLAAADAAQILDTEEAHGLIVRYRAICNKINFNTARTNLGYFGPFELNDTKEKVFITGLNLDFVTDRCRIYHYKAGNEYFLYVWPIGIQTLPLDETGKTYRLKKYTVDPKVALAYYELQQKQNFP